MGEKMFSRGLIVTGVLLGRLLRRSPLWLLRTLGNVTFPTCELASLLPQRQFIPSSLVRESEHHGVPNCLGERFL